MSIDGRWEISFATPEGEQKATVDFTSNGSVLTGTAVSGGLSQGVGTGTIDGNKVSWTSEITEPVKATINATATFEGDTLTGTVKADGGDLPESTFTGKRIG